MATDDIRVRVDFPSHPKTVRMMRRLGEAGVLGVVFLWLAARRRSPTGDLPWSEEDVEIEAGWHGKSGAFVAAAIEAGFLERLVDGFRIPSWPTEQQWAFAEPARRASSSHAANRRWGNPCARGCRKCAKEAEEAAAAPPDRSEENQGLDADRMRGAMPSSPHLDSPPLHSKRVQPGSTAGAGSAVADSASLVLVAEVAKKPIPGLTELRDAFDSGFRRASGGAAPTWGPVPIKMLKDLLAKHGLEECASRLRVFFHGPRPDWPPGHDLKTFVGHFDKWVPNASGKRGKERASGVQVWRDAVAAEQAAMKTRGAIGDDES